MVNKAIKTKIIFVFVCFVALFLIVLGKAFKVQIIDRQALMERSKSQFFRQAKVYPKRGNIYDRNGNPLAINIQTYSIFTIPKNVKNNSTYKKLAEIVPSLTYRKLRRRVDKRKRFTWLARKIELTKEQAKRIKELKGVHIESVPKRLYPNHELASQLLGFVGIDNVGLAGVEYRFDKKLKGQPRVLKYIIDNKGRPAKFTSVEAGDKAEDIHLSIDKDLQTIAEKSLKDAVVKHQAVRGGIGIMDSETGEVLAMANYPTFDPNVVRKSKAEDRKLSFVTDPIEPGSVFKILTVASALENKIARPDTNYYCEQGKFKVEDHIITEAESKKNYEWLSMSEIIKYSSNIGTTKIAFDLTYPKLKKTLTTFGVGRQTGIELPGESRGILTESENVPPLSLSNISFGQGVATTGVQMLSVYSAIANNGLYQRPTIIKGGSKDKPVRVLSEQTATELTQMLTWAVEDGTGTSAKIPYFKIAGKTSTAQRPDEKGGYSGYISGFVGFPLNVDKKFVIYVYVDGPQNGQYYGSLVAAPVFKKVAQHLLYKNKSFNRLTKTHANSDRFFDSVKVKHSSTRLLGRGIMPNLIGLDKKSARRIGERLKFKMVHRGIGVVSEQSPKAGTQLSKNSVIKLKYAPPSYE